MWCHAYGLAGVGFRGGREGDGDDFPRRERTFVRSRGTLLRVNIGFWRWSVLQG